MGLSVALELGPGLMEGGWPLEWSAFTQAISPTNLLTNGSMETGNPPSNWTLAADATLSAAADERTGGAGAQSLQVARGGASASPYAYQQITVTQHKWFVFSGWQKRVDATHSYIRAVSGSESLYAPPTPYNQNAGTWVKATSILRGDSTALQIRLYDITSGAGQYNRFDDVGVYQLTLNETKTLPSADAEIEITLSLPSSPIIGDQLSIYYRLDGTLEADYTGWVMHFFRDEDNDNWNVNLNSVSTGTSTNRAALTSIGVPEKLRIICNGTEHQCSMYASGTWTPLHVVVDVDNGASTNTLMNVLYTSGMAPTLVKARISSPFDFGLSGTGLLFLDGDSKTDNTASYGYWDFMLESLLEQRNRKQWTYYNVANAGDTLAEGLAGLAANLAGLAATPQPDYALINFGANDVQSLPAEATWKANMRTYCETIHAKWSDTPIIFALIWRDGYDAQSNTLDTWIGEVAAEYGYVYTGMDERNWFEVDPTLWASGIGTHYNGAGNRVCAMKWDLYLS